MHLWKKCYGKLIGRAREKEVCKIVTGPEKLVSPSTRAKPNLMKVESSEFAVGNHVGQATDRYVQYEMNREAKAVLHEQFDLTNNPLANAINVAESLRKKI